MNSFDPFGDVFGASAGRPAPTPKPEKGVPWEAKIIDGQYYVPLRQVAELLAANDVLSSVRKGIDRRVSSQEKRDA